MGILEAAPGSLTQEDPSRPAHCSNVCTAHGGHAMRHGLFRPGRVPAPLAGASAASLRASQSRIHFLAACAVRWNLQRPSEHGHLRAGTCPCSRGTLPSGRIPQATRSSRVRPSWHRSIWRYLLARVPSKCPGIPPGDGTSRPQTCRAGTRRHCARSCPAFRTTGLRGFPRQAPCRTGP